MKMTKEHMHPNILVHGAWADNNNGSSGVANSSLRKQRGTKSHDEKKNAIKQGAKAT
jgi:hypothetical protein